jgi:hypothetical protein
MTSLSTEIGGVDGCSLANPGMAGTPPPHHVGRLGHSLDSCSDDYPSAPNFGVRAFTVILTAATNARAAA